MIRRFRSSLSRTAYPFRISLLGVPEQVNTPIKLCLEHGIFAKYGVDVNYITVREGTGAMLKMLCAGEADLAITVTDGFIAGQAAGSKVALVGTYVKSPLVWAVCAHPDSKLTCIEDFFKLDTDKRTIGISRPASGSHTMSFYMNHIYNSTRDPQPCNYGSAGSHGLRFKVLGGFEDLIAGIHRGEADIFLWEKFTTKPSFNSGELKYLGEISTPWPAFSIVAPSASTSASFRSAPLLLTDPAFAHMYRHRFLPALAEGVQLFEHRNIEEEYPPQHCVGWDCQNDMLYGGVGEPGSSVDRIVAEFGHTPADASRWMDQVRYAVPDMPVDVAKMRMALNVLKGVGLVPSHYVVSDLWCGLANRAVVLTNDQPIPSPRDAATPRQIRQKTLTCGGQDLSGW